MKISRGLSEDGIIVGNVYDKYNSKNPIVQKIMQGFEDSLNNMVKRANVQSIHEIGCGEGYWILKWNKQGFNARGSDFSLTVIELARENAKTFNLPSNQFLIRSIYDLTPTNDSAELIVCCEILEHLENPEKALEKLQTLNMKNIILSVPREPVWSIMNMARGKYWSNFGNTPGHINKWSKQAFINLVSNYFIITDIQTPLPWIMLLCQPREMDNP